jgi:hypothetical protein
MRKITLAIFAILLLSLLIMCSACTTSTQEVKNTPLNSGLSQETQQAESQYISFDIALHNLPAYRPDALNESYFTPPIYYFTGLDVDGSGDARNWIFGVGNTTGTRMLAYDGNGWIAIPWNAPPGSEEIAFDSIISPGQLFSKNREVIIGNPSSSLTEKRDLELNKGVYTLTITSGDTNRILTFNATTGELIP